MLKTSPNFTATISVAETPEQAFAAITNLRGWWSEDINGATNERGKTFTYRYGDSHRCTLETTELVPGERVVWRVLDNYFAFTEDKTEWIGTELAFELSRGNGETEIRFTHRGLVPEYECFGVCSSAWGTYVNSSLRKLITTGNGQPNPRQTG